MDPTTAPGAPSGTIIRNKPRERPCERGVRLTCLGILSSIVLYTGIILGKADNVYELFSRYKENAWDAVYSSVNGAFSLRLPTMRSILLTAFTFCTAVLSQGITIEKYISSQGHINKAGIRANIGPNGSKAAGAGAGLVIASPTTFDPDYLYTWSRDSALVFKSLIDECIHGEDTSWDLRTSIDQYVTAQERLQQVSNPSGTVSTGGLGEPKFNINFTAFTDSWGRPQRDGPPLRATALITYANWLLKNSNTTHVKNNIWPVVKLDLDYTAKYWNQSGFDLWEEVSSRSFFTTAVQHRALREGATFATKLGQKALATEYRTQAARVLCFLQTYWNPTEKYITSNTGGGRSGKDANSVLASIHTFDATAGCDSKTFQPCSDKALANHKAYVDVFRSLYPINGGIASNGAVATGRYAEDVYYGGQPWYLTTAAAAHQLYNALTVWKSTGSLQVTDISLEFFRQFSPSVKAGTYRSSTSTYITLTKAIRKYADGFLLVNARYTPSDGALSEQYNKINGTQLSAKDLTWSYAATNEAFGARAGFVAASWGAAGLVVPSVCESNIDPTVNITFNVVADTESGESIFLTGSIDELKNWSPADAIALSAASHPTWSVTLDIPASTNFEYKYIRKNGAAVTWESDPNRSFSSPANGTWVINNSWQ